MTTMTHTPGASVVVWSGLDLRLGSVASPEWLYPLLLTYWVWLT
jgi:hypothetical protein